MHHSTLIVLLLVTLGQMLILAFGFFALWLAGEFSDESKPRPRVFSWWFRKAKEPLEYRKRRTSRHIETDASGGRHLDSWVKERGGARQIH
jgi:hypothetical protein